MPFQQNLGLVQREIGSRVHELLSNRLRCSQALVQPANNPQGRILLGLQQGSTCTLRQLLPQLAHQLGVKLLDLLQGVSAGRALEPG